VQVCRGDDLKASVAACTRIIERGGAPPIDRASAYINRAFAYTEWGEYDRAIRDSDDAIRLDATQVNGWINRAQAYYRKNDYARAIADFDAALRREPKSAVALLGRGSAYERTADYDRAIRDLSQAARLSPRDSTTFHNRGLAYYGKRDFDRAIRDFDESIRLAPKDAVSYKARADAYDEKGLYDIALRDYDQAIRLDPDDSGGYHNRGITYGHKRDYDRAIADFDQAIKRSPNDAISYRARADAYESNGQFDHALRDYDQAIVLDPRQAKFFNNRGHTYRRKGEFDLAIRDFDAAIALDAKFATAFLNRGLAYEQKGDSARAITDMRSTLDLDPNESLAGAALARLQDAAPAALAAPAAAVAALSVPPHSQRQPAPTPATAPLQRRVALVIGNGAYRFANPLPNPANDAGDVAAALRRLGFDVVEGRDLDKRGIEDRVREFARKLDRADLALFFYAGHGIQVGGKNYIVPIDAKLERPGDLSFDTVEVGQVLAQMEAEQRVNLVFLDACRDNPLARSLARSLGARSAAVGQGLAVIHSALGTMISFATQPDNVALDGEGRNSPFSAALVKHLATPHIDIGVIMRRVRAEVVEATKGKQVPWDHSSLIGEVVLAR
ncbi:MAG: tetratricopeptide repeat protein, partial [Proteobacteria bacterium]|nr:tetratricopeptide repeat protein [Pseudomonadota bacterium]